MIRRSTSILKSTGIYFFLIVSAFIYISPILLMITGSLKPDERVLVELNSWKALIPDTLAFQNYSDVFERIDFARFMFNSCLITGSIVVLGSIVNSMAGYALARLKWKGRDVCLSIILALMILPFESIAVPLFYQMMMLGWRDTYIAQIMPFIANAFSIYLFYSFFNTLPREMEESAYVDGAGPFQTFLNIIVPNSKPVFATSAIMMFLMFWGLYLWPLMITGGETVRPLPVAIAEFYSLPPLQWGDIMAFGVMMVVPVILIFVAFQHWYVKGITVTGMKN